MERALDLEKQVLMGHPADGHPGRLQRRFHPGQEAVEFGEKFLMIPSRAFDTLRGRKTQASTRFHFSFPLKVRRLLVNPGVPDEVQMEKMLQVEASGLTAPPQLDMQPIEFAEHLTLVLALPDVAGYQIARALRYLKPHLHPHGSFGQRSHEGFEQPLEAIPSFIARVIRLNASNL